jgi:hypothetical protein
MLPVMMRYAFIAAIPAKVLSQKAIRLTAKLRGRPKAPIKRRGRTLSSRARGA